jgi:hypothetical protein
MTGGGAVRSVRAARLLALLAAHPDGLTAPGLATLDGHVSIARCSSDLQYLRVLGYAAAAPFARGTIPVWHVTEAGSAALAAEGT